MAQLQAADASAIERETQNGSDDEDIPLYLNKTDNSQSNPNATGNMMVIGDTGRFFSSDSNDPHRPRAAKKMRIIVHYKDREIPFRVTTNYTVGDLLGDCERRFGLDSGSTELCDEEGAIWPESADVRTEIVDPFTYHHTDYSNDNGGDNEPDHKPIPKEPIVYLLEYDAERFRMKNGGVISPPVRPGRRSISQIENENSRYPAWQKAAGSDSDTNNDNGNDMMPVSEMSRKAHNLSQSQSHSHSSLSPAATAVDRKVGQDQEEKEKVKDDTNTTSDATTTTTTISIGAVTSPLVKALEQQAELLSLSNDDQSHGDDENDNDNDSPNPRIMTEPNENDRSGNEGNGNDKTTTPPMGMVMGMGPIVPMFDSGEKGKGKEKEKALPIPIPIPSVNSSSSSSIAGSTEGEGEGVGVGGSNSKNQKDVLSLSVASVPRRPTSRLSDHSQKKASVKLVHYSGETTWDEVVSQFRRARIASHIRLTWHQKPRFVLIIVKLGADSLLEKADEVARFLIDNWEIECFVEPSVQQHLPHLSTWEKDEEHLLSKVIDFVVCLGGDGTFLHISRMFDSSCPPIMAVAFGSLGFLTPFNYGNITRDLTSLMESKCFVTPRHRMYIQIVKQCEEERKEEVVFDTLCLNEVVVDRGSSSFLTNLVCYVDNKFVTRVQADGLIIATPTGSTAYSVSAGGSMVHPHVQSLLFTPISPHSLSFRPIVLPDTSTLTIQVPFDARDDSFFSVDGGARQTLERGSKVVCKMCEWPVPSVSLSDQTGDWFRKLADCLSWNTRRVQVPLESNVRPGGGRNMSVKMKESSQ